MARIHTLGFPRIGADRELKKALEAHWKGELSPEGLEDVGRALRQRHGSWQAGFDLVPVGDFSFYDHVADLSLTLGVVPPRHRGGASTLDTLFRMARGAEGAPACEMTKWLNTNYHYLVPEFDRSTTFRLAADRWVDAVREARGAGLTPKPVLVGPLTYLALGQAGGGWDRLSLLPALVEAYLELLTRLAAEGVTWVQLDEPWLGTELESGWDQAYRRAYRRLAEAPVSILVATYFGRLGENRELALGLPVAGLHLDAVTSPEEAYGLADRWPGDKVLSLGVVNGRNVWITDLGSTLDRLEPLHARLGDRLWVAPSCSLLHVPVDLASETRLDPKLRSTLAFARQKLDEVRVLGQALNHGRAAVAEALEANARAVAGRTRGGAAAVVPGAPRARAPYALREALQRERLGLPRFPTTTIGSFPQTAEVRQVRRRFKDGLVTEGAYRDALRQETCRTIRAQEDLGLDVLVHGEAERNDMVEYFGEQLEGYAFTDFGWVQSYGSRCVKPPLLFGHLSRRRPLTVEWITYAQSLTTKPVKGMLTGPVTMLNWSFVRDDQPRETTCRQLAVALRDEVLDLERAGVAIIQIDEAALREGLPLRRSDRAAALAWAVECFHLMANEVADHTQIHTHMCYSEFNEILPAIAALDADVLTVESARSAERLLAGLGRFAYPNALGPGVYDIHSPQVPTVEEIEARMVRASQVVPADRLWVNPDCGLKTRTWAEVTPALANLVEAARRLRKG